MDGESSSQSIVKCVVVGDTAVGKTRLIRARACNAYITLQQAVAPHIPTVFAIDQYRIHKEVLQRSWSVVDGVKVSLRLWDTFGDHEKDRQFAYGRADVVVLCFSISNSVSLKNCKSKWLPEIHHYCPNTPIVLVGCKNDLRHIQSDFIAMWKEKRPFVKILQPSDMISVDECRTFADEIGTPYYESSAHTRYGIEQAFENAVRLALKSRNSRRIWFIKTKDVQSPTLQKPFLPHKPPEPELNILDSTYNDALGSLFGQRTYADVRFLTKDGNCCYAHVIVLAAVSPYFRSMFSLNPSEDKQVTTFHWMTFPTMINFLTFLYGGTLDVKQPLLNLQHLLVAAKIVRVKELEEYVRNIESNEEFKNSDVKKRFLSKLQSGMIEMGFISIGSDIVFELDNGSCHANRALLTARSDVMAAMFGGNFCESSYKSVSYPGISKQCFQQLLVYLYSDKLDVSLCTINYMPLLQLANQLCLNHLITLIEAFVINELREACEMGVDISEHVCTLLEPAEVHNAYQLAEWYRHYISIHYTNISVKWFNLLRSLSAQNQATLNLQRWPPASYLKEIEYYERCCEERQFQDKKPRQWQNARKKFRGILSFFRKLKNQ